MRSVSRQITREAHGSPRPRPGRRLPGRGRAPLGSDHPDRLARIPGFAPSRAAQAEKHNHSLGGVLLPERFEVFRERTSQRDDGVGEGAEARRADVADRRPERSVRVEPVEDVIPARHRRRLSRNQRNRRALQAPRHANEARVRNLCLPVGAAEGVLIIRIVCVPSTGFFSGVVNREISRIINRDLAWD